MNPIKKLRALLESKGIYDQAIRLMRAHVALREAAKRKKITEGAARKPQRRS